MKKINQSRLTLSLTLSLLIIFQSCRTYKTENFIVDKQNSKQKLTNLHQVQYIGNFESKFGITALYKSKNVNSKFKFKSEHRSFSFQEQKDKNDGYIASTKLFRPTDSIFTFNNNNNTFTSNTISVFPNYLERSKRDSMVLSKLYSLIEDESRDSVYVEYQSALNNYDFNPIFFNSMNNIMDKSQPKGYISYKITDFKESGFGISFFLLLSSYITLTTINLIGIPAMKVKKKMGLEVSIHDINGDVIKTYDSYASKSTYVAYYYGYTITKVLNASLSKVYYSALSDIIEKINNDISEINQELNERYEEYVTKKHQIKK